MDLVARRGNGYEISLYLVGFQAGNLNLVVIVRPIRHYFPDCVSTRFFRWMATPNTWSDRQNMKFTGNFERNQARPWPAGKKIFLPLGAHGAAFQAFLAAKCHALRPSRAARFQIDYIGARVFASAIALRAS